MFGWITKAVKAAFLRGVQEGAEALQAHQAAKEAHDVPEPLRLLLEGPQEPEEPTRKARIK